MKKGAPQPATKTQPKVAEKKAFKAQDYASSSLPVEEIISIKQAFDVFDQDHSGIVDPRQIGKAFEELGFQGKQFVYQILAELDEDLSGGIDFQQFVKLVTTKPPEKTSRAQVYKIFRAFDANRIGKFAVSDLKRVAGQIGEQVSDDGLDKIFTNADLDDDGFVTQNDFYNIMTHKVYWDQ